MPEMSLAGSEGPDLPSQPIWGTFPTAHLEPPRGPSDLMPSLSQWCANATTTDERPSKAGMAEPHPLRHLVPTRGGSRFERESTVRSSSMPSARSFLLAVALATTLAGCRGDRILRIDSIPQGAEVRLDDELVGLTPVEVDFEHYGQRRLGLYRIGYRTYSERLPIEAPWWARFPVDILTEVIVPLGLDDVREVRVDLVADTGREAEQAIENFRDHARRARAGESLVGVPLAGAEDKPVVPSEVE